MPITSRKLAGVAGICVIALAATTAPVTTATATGDEDTRTVDLLSAAPSARTGDVAGERSRGVRLDTAALEGVRSGDRVSLALFDDTTVTAAINHRDTVDGITSWSGGIVGETGTVSAVEVGGATHINVASAEHGTYEVTRTRGGDYVAVEAGEPPNLGDDVAEIEGHADHADHADARRPLGDGAAREADTAGADAPGTIDVAIVYPAALATQLGAAAMQAQFAQGIAQTNEAFRNSGIPTTLRLVGTRQVASAQLSSLTANINALGTPGDGVFDEAQALREETHADLVSLWLAGSVPGGESCGIGSLGGSYPQSDAERAAWTVVYAADCATTYRVFAHEIGHNLSAHHDAGAAQPPTDGKPYARGYVDVPAKTITVMSYYDQCTRAGVNDCTRIGYFSSPGVAFNGRAQGTAATNNVQAVNEQIAAVAAYRESQIYAGAVSIAGRARFKGSAVAASTPWSPNVTLGYQWFVDGVAVPGATAETFKASRRDIGRSLTVLVTGSAPFYPSVSAPTAAVVIGKALFRTKRPKVRGVPRAGRVLSARVKGWKPAPAKKSVKVRYQWLKNGKKIKGAKKATYRVRGKDRGKKISVRVTVKKKSYEKASRTSRNLKIRR